MPAKLRSPYIQQTGVGIVGSAAGSSRLHVSTVHMCDAIMQPFSVRTIIYIEFLSSINTRPFIHRLQATRTCRRFCTETSIVRLTTIGRKHLKIARLGIAGVVAIFGPLLTTARGRMSRRAASYGWPSVRRPPVQLCKWHKCYLYRDDLLSDTMVVYIWPRMRHFGTTTTTTTSSFICHNRLTIKPKCNKMAGCQKGTGLLSWRPMINISI